jgi:antitoxin component YwqK of YwqJK toxin-antitoxin module
MTKQFTLIFLLFILSLLIACSSKSKIVEIRNGDGLLLEKYEISQDSIKHGNYTSYYEDGNIFESSNFKMGVLDGIRELYFPDGAIEIQENYVDGTIEGPYNTYYNNGKPNVQCNYNNGVLEGIVKKYHRTGELMEEVTFQDNLENGPFTEYYKTGSEKWKGNYINGNQEVGELDSFSLEGDLMKKMMCGKFMGQYICQTIWTAEAGDVPLKLEFDAE